MFRYGNQVISYNVTDNGCWECIDRHVSRLGYPQIRFKSKLYNVHRLIFILEKNNGIELTKDILVRHTCDNPLCINPEHLLSGTQKDNMQDASERNRLRKGKISDEDIILIRSLHESGFKKKVEIAKIFGLTRGQISEITNFNTYKKL